MNGKLYIVATPIGNLEDITLRALQVLKEVDIIAAEDRRITLKLLNYYGIKKDLLSFHEHNSKRETERILNILKEGKNIALVSDAGTPCISDPGSYLVKRAREEGIRVVPVPGASAIVAALSVSGLNLHSFHFAGFLPSSRTKRLERLNELLTLNCPIVIFESPHRVTGTIEDLKELSPEMKLILFREITKLHEEVLEGNPEEIKNLLSKKGKPLGEFILILNPENSRRPDEEEIKSILQKIFARNFTKEEIIDIIKTLRSVSKNQVYKAYLRFKGGNG